MTHKHEHGLSWLSSGRLLSKLKPVQGDIEFGNDIERAGDLNGDGGDDFLVTSEKAIYVSFRSDSVICLDASDMGFGGYVSAGTGGNVNHDGYDIIVIGSTNHRIAGEVMVGGCFLYLGGG